MPELPEVETTARELKKEIRGLAIFDVWTDWERAVKEPRDFSVFKKKIKGAVIKDIRRRGKMLLFFFNRRKLMLAHQKLTGHFLLGKWRYQPKAKRKWQSLIKGALEDKINDYIHLVFNLSDGRQLAFSDLRKFGWVALYENIKPEDLKEIKALGIDPQSKEFTLSLFKTKLSKTRKKLKQALLDQNLISGIGNIYSDEILWQAKLHPEETAQGFKEKDFKILYWAIKNVLKKAIKLKGSTVASNTEEYRLPSGQKGGYQEKRYVYRRTGEKCLRCQNKIQRIKIGQRSAHFCPVCQTTSNKR